LLGHFLIIFGLSGSTAYGWFRFLGQKWIEQKFSKSLEEFKHEQAKEIAKQQLQIDSIFNRVSKLHDKEYEILPQIWKYLNKTYLRLLTCNRSLRTAPDYNKMNPEEFDYFLNNEGSNFSNSEKLKLQKSQNKAVSYREIQSEREYRSAEKAYHRFNHLFALNSIFLDVEIRQCLEKIDNKFSSFLRAIEYSLQYNEPRHQYEEAKKFFPIIEDLYKDIEQKLHSRIFPRVNEDRELLDPRGHR